MPPPALVRILRTGWFCRCRRPQPPFGRSCPCSCEPPPPPAARSPPGGCDPGWGTTVINTDGVSWGPSGDLSGEGVCRYARRVSAMLSGYARCSTDEQDLTGQRLVLLGVGVAEDRIYLVKGLTGTNRAGPAWSRSSRPCGPGTPLSWRSWTGSRARCPTPAASVTLCRLLGAAVAGRDDLRPDRPDGEDVRHHPGHPSPSSGSTHCGCVPTGAWPSRGPRAGCGEGS
jgi:hypothetical protein